MSEKSIVESIKENVRMQNDSWRFVMGRESLTKSEVLKRLDNDKGFRKSLVKLVVELSIDILARKPES